MCEVDWHVLKRLPSKRWEQMRLLSVPTFPLRGYQPGRQVDRERQYDRVEQKREQRVDQ